MKTFLFLLLISAAAYSSGTKEIIPDHRLLYKVIDGDSLYLHVFMPQLSKKPTAAIVFFFGGGWTGGSPVQFYQQSKYFASRGILAISAEYRTENRFGVSPFECVEDAKSAIRYVRQHSSQLNIDPDKIVASGGSAGGHLAICTAIINGLENPNEDLSISSQPNAVVGYNPVFDTTEKGYGHKKVAERKTEVSPCHQVKKNMPPMLNFHGTKDSTVPYENAERFTRLMQEAGNKCELVAFEGEDHGFFNGDYFIKGAGDKNYNLCMYDTDVFLKKLGFLKGKPTLVRNLKM